MSITCFVSHFDISGIDFNEEHDLNIPLIISTFFVFHLEISGKYFKDEQQEKI